MRSGHLAHLGSRCTAWSMQRTAEHVKQAMPVTGQSVAPGTRVASGLATLANAWANQQQTAWPTNSKLPMLAVQQNKRGSSPATALNKPQLPASLGVQCTRWLQHQGSLELPGSVPPLFQGGRCRETAGASLAPPTNMQVNTWCIVRSSNQCDSCCCCC